MNALSSTFSASSRSAFTLIEMITTVAALVILLGLMVSLARDVRNRSANELTGEVLEKLDRALMQYSNKFGGRGPEVEMILRAGATGGSVETPSEEDIRNVGWKNNE